MKLESTMKPLLFFLFFTFYWVGVPNSVEAQNLTNDQINTIKKKAESWVQTTLEPYINKIGSGDSFEREAALKVYTNYFLNNATVVRDFDFSKPEKHKNRSAGNYLKEISSIFEASTYKVAFSNVKAGEFNPKTKILRVNLSRSFVAKLSSKKEIKSSTHIQRNIDVKVECCNEIGFKVTYIGNNDENKPRKDKDKNSEPKAISEPKSKGKSGRDGRQPKTTKEENFSGKKAKEKSGKKRDRIKNSWR